MDGIGQAEIVKYLFGFIITLGGSYVVFIIKSIGKDINQLKEFFLLQIKNIETDVLQQRQDIQKLYNLHRSLSDKQIENAGELKALKDDHNRRHGGK